MGFLEMREELEKYLKEDASHIETVLASACAILTDIRREKEDADNSEEG